MRYNSLNSIKYRKNSLLEWQWPAMSKITLHNRRYHAIGSEFSRLFVENDTFRTRERNKFQLLEIERKIPGWKRLIESGKLIRAKSITIRVCHAWMSNGRIHRFLLTNANNILGETFYLYDTDIQITIETRFISRPRLSSIRNNFPSLLEYCV